MSYFDSSHSQIPAVEDIPNIVFFGFAIDELNLRMGHHSMLAVTLFRYITNPKIQFHSNEFDVC